MKNGTFKKLFFTSITFFLIAVSPGHGDINAPMKLRIASDHHFTALPTTGSGWTNYSAMIHHPELYKDARVVFVSANKGNDGTGGIYTIDNLTFDSHGMFQPKSEIKAYATITKAFSMIRDGFPDILLLERGNIWTERFSTGGIGRWSKSGRSRAERMILSSYGSGERPKFFSDETGTAFDARDAQNIIVAGIWFHAPAWQSANRAIDITGLARDQLYEDCLVQEHYNNKIQGGSGGPVQNIAFRRCVFSDHNAHDGIFYAARTTGLLFEENLFYKPRRPGSEEMGRHLYLSPSGEGDDKHALKDIVIRGNVFYWAERGGIDGRAGGTIDNNLFVRSTVRLGSGGGSADSIQSGDVYNNVFLEGAPNTGGGSNLNIVNIDGASIHNNVWTDPSNISQGTVAIQVTGDREVHLAKNIRIFNNVVFGWKGSGTGRAIQIYEINDIGNVNIYNNDMQMINGSKEIVSVVSSSFVGLHFANNRYFSIAPSHDWFNPGGTIAGWLEISSETGANESQVSYPDAGRNVKTYSATLGGSASTEDFMEKLLKQSRFNWRTEYTAISVNNYIREGFGKDAVIPNYR